MAMDWIKDAANEICWELELIPYQVQDIVAAIIGKHFQKFMAGRKIIKVVDAGPLQPMPYDLEES